jgi:GntR family transcriptional regulator
MNSEKAIPLYYQIESILRRKIMSGDLPPGSPLPSEEVLGKEFEVSRITVRRALSILEDDGLILRQRGRGTFVTDKPQALESPRFSGSMEELIAMGVRTEARIMDKSLVEPPETVKKKLNLKPESRVLRIEKIRMVEGEPFSYVINYLPEAIGEKIVDADLSLKPLLMIMEENLGLVVHEAEQSVEAVVAEPEWAELLEIRVGDPLLKVERTVFDPQDNPLEFVWVLYRADKYFLNVKLKRERSADSGVWAPAGLK